MILLLIIFGLYFWYNPKIDETSEGDLLLWYGRTTRDYMILWRKN